MNKNSLNVKSNGQKTRHVLILTKNIHNLKEKMEKHFWQPRKKTALKKLKESPSAKMHHTDSDFHKNHVGNKGLSERQIGPDIFKEDIVKSVTHYVSSNTVALDSDVNTMDDGVSKTMQEHGQVFALSQNPLARKEKGKAVLKVNMHLRKRTVSADIEDRLDRLATFFKTKSFSDKKNKPDANAKVIKIKDSFAKEFQSAMFAHRSDIEGNTFLTGDGMSITPDTELESDFKALILENVDDTLVVNSAHSIVCDRLFPVDSDAFSACISNSISAQEAITSTSKNIIGVPTQVLHHGKFSDTTEVPGF